MKVLFLFLFCSAVWFSGCTDDSIASGTAGSLVWSLSNDGTLTISGNGAMPDYIDYNPGIGKSPGVYTYIAPWPSTITAVVINKGVTSIGGGAFLECSELTSVIIPNTVTSIGESAFRRCSSLTSVTIPNSVSSIGANAFLHCSGLTSVTIPNSVTTIEYRAFESCSKLTSVTIPNSVTSIEGLAFMYCIGLTSITIPNSVASLGGNAFGGCSELTSATIGNSVTFIEVLAFRQCEKLTEIINHQEIPQEIDSSVFVFVDKTECVLYVPAGSVEAYRTTDEWKKFENIKAIK